jgi:hypothetical protein
MLRVAPAVFELGLLVFCLIECIQAPEGEIRNLPRWGWLILIILVPLVGGIAWLVAGRPLRSSRSAGRPGGAWPSAAGRSGTGRYGDAPRGPDDDADFLANLRRADSEHEDVLRRWEEDLRRREEQLKPTDRPPGALPPDEEDPPGVIP